MRLRHTEKSTSVMRSDCSIDLVTTTHCYCTHTWPGSLDGSRAQRVPKPAAAASVRNPLGLHDTLLVSRQGAGTPQAQVFRSSAGRWRISRLSQ
jgi:hypothetical protein